MDGFPSDGVSTTSILAHLTPSGRRPPHQRNPTMPIQRRRSRTSGRSSGRVSQFFANIFFEHDVKAAEEASDHRRPRLVPAMTRSSRRADSARRQVPFEQLQAQTCHRARVCVRRVRTEQMGTSATRKLSTERRPRHLACSSVDAPSALVKQLERTVAQGEKCTLGIEARKIHGSAGKEKDIATRFVGIDDIPECQGR